MQETNKFYMGERIKFARGKGLREDLEGRFGTIVGVGEQGKAIVQDITCEGTENEVVDLNQLEHTATNMYLLDMIQTLSAVTVTLDNRLQDVEEKVKAKAQQNPTIADMAKEAGVSRQWIYKLKEKLGHTPTLEEVFQHTQKCQEEQGE